MHQTPSDGQYWAGFWAGFAAAQHGHGGATQESPDQLLELDPWAYAGPLVPPQPVASSHHVDRLIDFDGSFSFRQRNHIHSDGSGVPNEASSWPCTAMVQQAASNAPLDWTMRHDSVYNEPAGSSEVQIAQQEWSTANPLISTSQVSTSYHDRTNALNLGPSADGGADGINGSFNEIFDDPVPGLPDDQSHSHMPFPCQAVRPMEFIPVIESNEGPRDSSVGSAESSHELQELTVGLRRPTKRDPTVSSTLQTVRKRDLVGATEIVFRAHGRKRARYDEVNRTATALTRKTGACDACKQKKLRCKRNSQEKFIACTRCAALPPDLLRQPCCLIDIIDCRLFRQGSTRNPTSLIDWMTLKALNKRQLQLEHGTVICDIPRKIWITQDINSCTFPVTVASFDPDSSDVVAYPDTDPVDGTKTTYEMPPFYIVDMEEAGESLRKYFSSARKEYPIKILQRSNPILWKTFQEAERYCRVTKSVLIETALLLWSATRMIERTWLICGDDLLGMPPMEHNIGPCRPNPAMRCVPVTPQMDTQLDQLSLLGVVVPLGRRVLHMLKKKVLEGDRKNWYEIYLTTFLVLSNAENVLRDVLHWTSGCGRQPTLRGNTESSLTHGYYYACMTVLAYYRFASKGVSPFLSKDWTESAAQAWGLDSAQIAYVSDMRAEVKRQEIYMQTLKQLSMYETEMFWCHQLLFTDWKDDTPYAGEFLPFTEEDFLI